MNSSTQAQKGLKTFLLTLVVSLVVFSAIYYVINSGASSDEAYYDYEADYKVSKDRVDPAVGESRTLGKAVERAPQDDPKSVFEELANSQMNVHDEDVLAATDVLAGATSADTTETATIPESAVVESTVPVTGISRPTVGLLVSLMLLGVAGYFIYLGPRKLALSSFEKEVIDDLD